MAGQEVTFASNGGTCGGYLAKPASGSGKGVLVFQEWWGVVPHIRNLCDRFAEQGFVALAPDLYHGQVATEPDEAGKLMMSLTIDETAKDVRGAVNCLLANGASGAMVGSVGFCMGGQLALYAASVSPDQIGAVVDFYGLHPVVQPDFAKLKAPVLGGFAENDAMVPPAAAQQLEATLKQNGVTTDFKIYPGVDHAFFNDERSDVYNAAAAGDAWQRTLSWLNQYV